MFLYKLWIIVTNITITRSLTCEEILKRPNPKKLSLEELQSVEPKDQIQCLKQLGEEQLSYPEAYYIWESIINFYDGVANVPDNVLSTLHWVTVAVSPEDYANISLSSIEVVENFGFNYQLNELQLAAIADRVREEFGGKEPEDYTYYDLIALNQILCQFNTSEIERIHPPAYKEAASMIGKLENCSAEAMTGFATLAMDRKAFGPPETWSIKTIKVVGKVAEHLPWTETGKFSILSSSDKKRRAYPFGSVKLYA